MASNYKLNTLYKAFIDSFDVTYRCDLYEDICEFFNDEQMVTTDILFYWKVMIINLLKSHKKYAKELDTLKLDLATKTTNLRLVKEKYIFRCFLEDEHFCYFKENGTDYYI